VIHPPLVFPGLGGTLAKFCYVNVSDSDSAILVLPSLEDATQTEPIALLKLSKARTAIVAWEVLAKGKALYGWPPCTNKFVFAHLCFENIIYLFLKMSYPNEEVKGTSVPLLLVIPAVPLAGVFAKKLGK
jgi:hypothetical protein